MRRTRTCSRTGCGRWCSTGRSTPATWFGDRSGLARLNATGFQQALEAFFAGCRRNPAACRFGAGDPAAALDRLLARIEAQPLPVPGGAPVDRPKAVAAIGSALYDEAAWPVLAAALQRADVGDGTGLGPLADQQNGRKPDGSRDNSTDAQLAVICGDAGRYADPVALAADPGRGHHGRPGDAAARGEGAGRGAGLRCPDDAGRQPARRLRPWSQPVHRVGGGPVPDRPGAARRRHALSA